MRTKAIVLIILLLFSSGVWAQLSGPLNGTLTAGNYTVIDTIYVNSGDSLIIEPGTTLSFMGEYPFKVNGYLYAVGTETDSIIFRNDMSSEYWLGIKFFEAADDANQLAYGHITGAFAADYWESDGGGIACESCDLTLSHCRITNNRAYGDGAGIWVSSSHITIADCDISGNTAGEYYTGPHGGGFYGEESTVEIVNSVFTANILLGDAGRGGAVFVEDSDVLVSDCEIRESSGPRNGGGMYVSECTFELFNSQLIDNESDYNGGAISAGSCPQVTIDGCLFSGNESHWGGAIEMGGNTDYSVSHTLFLENEAHGGGAISINDNCIVQIDYCAFIRNHATWGGSGGIDGRNSEVTIVNCTFNENRCDSRGKAVCFEEAIDARIVNTILWGRQTWQVFSEEPITVEYSDIRGGYHGTGNIDEKPAFANPEEDCLSLFPISPCIDTGDPDSPLDPDGTRADMGAFFYDQQNPPLSLDIDPINPPIVIAASGGDFEFWRMIANDYPATVDLEVWVEILQPDSTVIEPLQLASDIQIAAGGITDQLIQSVPAFAMPGQYQYRYHLGFHPADAWFTDVIEFVKLESGHGPAVADWSFSEERAYEGDIVNGVAADTNPIQCSPNPFNPATVLSFKLQVASFVNLTVYDLTGREVAKLVNGWREAGRHEVTFDGAGLSSGVYFYRITAGEFNGVGKMVLLK